MRFIAQSSVKVDAHAGTRGVIVFESLVPFQITFSSRLASLFLRWKAHTVSLKGSHAVG